MDLNAIPKEAYGLIGTVIGASIGIFTNWITLRHQRKQEIVKLRVTRQRVRERVLHKDFSQRFQSLAKLSGGRTLHVLVHLVSNSRQNQ